MELRVELSVCFYWEAVVFLNDCHWYRGVGTLENFIGVIGKRNKNSSHRVRLVGGACLIS